MWDALWINGHVATMDGDAPYGAVQNGAVAVRDGRIAWVGAAADLSGDPASLARTVHDAEGCWLTPGLIDCHTHLVYAGNRAKEFAMRLEGASYEDIARAGGGIVSTVKATREASVADLVAQSRPRLDALRAEGVTTVEIKSGYGLNTESECAMLRAARQLAADTGVRIRTTFLGAHALPPEYKDRADEYIDTVCGEMIDAVTSEGLADAVDAFCESIGFSPAQTRRVFDAAAARGLPVKLHADQLSDLDGAALAAGYGALSADHLEYTSAAGARAMAGAGTVAVLLPGAFYCLRETKLPPMDLFREHGVAMAIASDCNPGSSPVASLLTIMNMACTLFRMTPEEALAGVTRNAARALGLSDGVGRLAAGMAADFVVWDIGDPAELAYNVGLNPRRDVIIAGHLVDV